MDEIAALPLVARNDRPVDCHSPFGLRVVTKDCVFARNVVTKQSDNMKGSAGTRLPRSLRSLAMTGVWIIAVLPLFAMT